MLIILYISRSRCYNVSLIKMMIYISWALATQRGGLFYFSIMYSCILCLYILLHVACGYSVQKTQVSQFLRILRGKHFTYRDTQKRIRLYRNSSVLLITLMVPFSLVPFAFYAKLFNAHIKKYIRCTYKRVYLVHI